MSQGLSKKKPSKSRQVWAWLVTPRSKKKPGKSRPVWAWLVTLGPTQTTVVL